MKKLLLTSLLLAGCSQATVQYQCEFDPLRPYLHSERCDREATRVGPHAPPPAPPDDDPEVTPPNDPDVCDGGARACHDGEAPTGTKSDPTKYLDKD